MPRCSVIIPAFNAEAFLRESIGSALTQTYSDLEVVVVNDGSTDATASVAGEFEGQISYLEQENRGPAAARNRAIEAAGGGILALLDADDVWLPDRLERMVAFLDDRRDIGFATSDAFLLREGGQARHTYYRNGPGRRGFRDEDQLYWICQYNFINGMVVMRREVLDSTGPFDEEIPWGVEDWDLWIRAIARGFPAGLLDAPLAHYRVRRESLSHDPGSDLRKTVAVLRKTASMESTHKIPGLPGRLALAEAFLALSSGDRGVATQGFKLASGDPNLPRSARTVAKVGARLPAVAGVAGAIRRRLSR